MQEFIAHPAKDGKNHQTVEQHLFEVHDLSGLFAKKIDQENAGKLIGLLHDFGKYSEEFQVYIRSAAGLIDSGDEKYVDAKVLKGKVDHSTAGAQWLSSHLIPIIAEKYSASETRQKIVALTIFQGFAQCIASHHSGLIDSIKTTNSTGFVKRIKKPDEETHLQECAKKADSSVLKQAQNLAHPSLLDEATEFVESFNQSTTCSELTKAFYWGMYTKFLFSCLIDADRISSADFDFPKNKLYRDFVRPDWDIACDRVEGFIAKLKPSEPIDKIRQKISEDCLRKAKLEQGIYSLTVPTGGGKTYSSLRYALHHAREYKLDRIIYIIPYTSIIDQNAQAIREVFQSGGDKNLWVYEHHSNLEPERQTWKSKLVCENWDAPVVLTTMVQFLETLFSGGTRGVRRLHQLANSVLIFDEIQTLPINCVHLFCNAINFLSEHCKTTAVMCTATQPLLNQLSSPEKGQLNLTQSNELTEDVADLFDALKRVEIVDNTLLQGWSLEEVTKLALEELEEKKSCLVIVNTKQWAQELYQSCMEKGVSKEKIYHLSTSQCPAHRKQLLAEIRTRLDAELPTLCISTALIEAGVDVDFNSVIRFLAGLDSIAQAAGRCNRNGRLSTAEVKVVNPTEENIGLLIDIKSGIEASRRIFQEYAGQDFLSPEIMRQYFEYYFYARDKDMSYSYKATPNSGAERDGNLLNLLSINKGDTKAHALPSHIKHSFMTAGKLFKAIDAPTKSLIVQYQQGQEIISELCSESKEFAPKRFYELLKISQKYSVNLFPNVWQKLMDAEAIEELHDENGDGLGIFYLNERYYSEEFGVSLESTENYRNQIC